MPLTSTHFPFNLLSDFCISLLVWYFPTLPRNHVTKTWLPGLCIRKRVMETHNLGKGPQLGPQAGPRVRYEARGTLMSQTLSSVVPCRYTIMAGTPEKILEHLLEMMRLDAQFTESGTSPPSRLLLLLW